MLEYLRVRLADDPPPLRLTFWDGDSFDFAPAPRVEITLRRPSLFAALLRGNFQQLGEAYVMGDLVVEGQVDEIVRVGLSLAERTERPSVLQRLRGLGQFARQGHSRREDAADIRRHYDVSNEFYRLWLDERMVYSCAYFVTGEEDIHLAQRQKLDHICRKLRLGPGERLLDIGCGWGGLLLWAAERYGVEGVGVTLSERQYDHARQRVAARGLAGKVQIKLRDYRDLSGEPPFDKIVSVGMYEHVGLRNLPLYFRTLAQLLRPGGALLNHGIVSAYPRSGGRQTPVGGFIDRYVFPGGAVAHLSRTLVEIAEAGLELADVEDLRPHYARTLLHWSRRLESHRQEAIRAAGAERYRIWRVYLASMAHAFDQGWMSVAQALVYKPTGTGPAPRPWTRSHQYSGEAQTPCAGSLDWSNV